MNNMQTYCKTFRVNILKLTLNELSELTATKPKTISAFEHGRSNNINHLAIYVKACSTAEQLTQFNHGFINALNKEV